MGYRPQVYQGRKHATIRISTLAMNIRPLSLLLLSSACCAQVIVETAEARFQVANPQPKGTMMQQVKQAHEKIKGKVYRYRVFVKPDADVGLISTVLRAPVLSIIRVAGLPNRDQKISVEAVTNGGRNPQGLVFVSGQGVNQAGLMPKVEPLVKTALDNVDLALKGVSITSDDVVALTCYISSMEDITAVKSLTEKRYPIAARNEIQIPVPYGRALVECEAVARAKGPVGFVYPEGLTKSPNFTQVTGISSKRMIFSGLHGSGACTEDNIRAMFKLLASNLEKNKASIKEAVFSYVYPNTQDGTDLTRKVRFEFFNKEKAPASTLLQFLGFQDKQSCTGLEVVSPLQ